MRRSIETKRTSRWSERPEGRVSRAEDAGDLGVHQSTELPSLLPRSVEDAGLDRLGLDRSVVGSSEHLDGLLHRGLEVPAILEPVLELGHEVLGVAADRDEPV